MKVLVTWSSKHGATQEIGSAVARRLEENGLTVDVLDIDAVNHLDGYDAVVLGSGIYAGQWMKQARTFIQTFAEDLQAMPVYLFSSGPLGDPPFPAADPAGLAQVLAAVGPRDHRLFAGRLDPRSLNIAERTVVRALHAPTGDYRDFGAVRAWADRIAADLSAEVGAVLG